MVFEKPLLKYKLLELDYLQIEDKEPLPTTTLQTETATAATAMATAAALTVVSKKSTSIVREVLEQQQSG